jgi:integrase
MGLKPVKKYKYAWEHTKHERAPRERSDNAIVSYMSAVRAYWRWCIDMGYTKNDPFRKYSVGSQKYGTPYYLTTEERDLLYKTDMGDDKDLRAARDIFVFQCYIGCRISDLLSFTENNIVTSDNGISVQYVPSKTKEERPRVVKVYLAPTAIEILERYKGKKSGPIFPFYATGKLNSLIRESLKKAGITRVVTIVNPRTKQSEQHPICDIASSHMARRTFIGNLYKKVKDPNLVGKLSGHCEGSKAFARYRDIDDDMIREMTNLLD